MAAFNARPLARRVPSADGAEPAVPVSPGVTTLAGTPPPGTPPAADGGGRMEITASELRATAVLLGFFLFTMAFAILWAGPSLEADLQQFEDPGDPVNVLVYIALILAFTFLILWIAKRGWKWIIRWLILLAVGSSIIFVVYPLLSSSLGMDPETSLWIALAAAAAVTLALWKHPEWYVIDTAGLIVAAGAASIFGISFVPWLVVLLLTLLAVYDAIAVYRTKHMLDLADSVIELRLPIMFVVPKTRGYSFLEETRKINKDQPEQQPGEKREAMFMGLGDAVFPGILVVSALAFLDPNLPAVLGMSAPLVVAFASLLGSFVGFCLLMYFVMKGRPHAGLPLLNGGAILGFLVALLPIYGYAPLFPWL